MSYAREDRDAVDVVVRALETLHHDVWIDQRLEGGHAWWSVILEQIRACDAMIVAVSRALLESDAAAEERTYARQLNRPLVPVLIAPVPVSILPPDLACLQFVDFTDIGPMTGIRLASAVAMLPATPPLPEQLPPEPPVPASILQQLADRARAQALPLGEQLAIVAMLGMVLGRPSDHDTAVELLQGLRARQDLYLATAREIDKLLRAIPVRATAAAGRPQAQPVSRGATDAPPEARKPAESRAPRTPTVAAVPAGWYPDPSHRHQLRWFERDWTRYAADSGTVVEDPDFRKPSSGKPKRRQEKKN